MTHSSMQQDDELYICQGKSHSVPVTFGTYYSDYKKCVFGTTWPLWNTTSLVHGHVQFGTSHFRYQDQFGTNTISVSVIECAAQTITF